MNEKNERIKKWWNQGCSIKRIAAKLGNPANIERVLDGLIGERLITAEQAKEFRVNPFSVKT